ncbi:MAG: acyl carrier protein [Mycobacteriales bacterium]
MLTGFDPAAVTALVASHLDLDPARLTPEALLAEDLAVDSLAAVELAMMLEDAYDISLPDALFARVFTWADLLRVVAEQLASRPTFPTP